MSIPETAAGQPAAVKKKEFTLNGKRVDIGRALPLTIADIRALKKQGIDLAKLAAGDIELEHMTGVTLYVCQKANPDFTDADLEMMPSNWMGKIFAAAQSQGDDDPGPF